MFYSSVFVLVLFAFAERRSGMWRREKDGEGGGGSAREFYQNFRCIEKFFGREEGIYKIFKSWGGCKILFFHLVIFFLNKNTDFRWEKAKIFKS